MLRPLAAALALTFAAVPAAAQVVVSGPPGPGAVLPSSGGEVILPTSIDVDVHQAYGFAAARRAGDSLYVSGVVVGPTPGDGPDVESFKTQVRRAFQRLEATLRAAGADFDDVAMINTFHVFDSPRFAGTKAEQFEAFLEVKNEFMRPPHAAWTAVGVTELLPDDGVVEIQMIAHDPPGVRPAR